MRKIDVLSKELEDLKRRVAVLERLPASPVPTTIWDLMWGDMIEHGVSVNIASRARSVMSWMRERGYDDVKLLCATPQQYMVSYNCGRNTLLAIGHWLHRHGYARSVEWQLLLGKQSHYMNET